MKVYFKLSKKKFASSTIYNLTPNKLYNCTKLPNFHWLYSIKKDRGWECILFIDKNKPCGHLNNLTHWTKYRPKSNKTNRTNQPKKV